MQKNVSQTHYNHLHPNVDPKHPGFKTRPPHQVFPEDIECVFTAQNGQGAIYIGNLQAAENLQTLKKHNIKSILTACKNVHISHPKDHVPYSLYIPGEDHQHYDISIHFDTACNFIHQSRQETNILVHCMAGISRSVTLVLAYLMKHKGLTYREATSLVAKSRRKINPNPGFVRQLINLQKQLTLKQQKNKQPANNDHNSRVRRQNSFGYALQYTKNRRTAADNNSLSFGQAERAGMNRSFTNIYEGYQTKFRTPKYSDYDAANITLPSSKINQYPNAPNPESSYLSYYKTQQGSPFNQSKADHSLQNTRLQVLTPLNNNQVEKKSSDEFQNLSKDLDERINKIKQKYYENAEYLTAGGKAESFYESKKLNNYVGENYNVNMSLARSRASKDSLRQTIYSPYKSRMTTYQYY